MQIEPSSHDRIFPADYIPTTVNALGMLVVSYNMALDQLKTKEPKELMAGNHCQCGQR